VVTQRECNANSVQLPQHMGHGDSSGCMMGGLRGVIVERGVYFDEMGQEAMLHEGSVCCGTR